MIDADERDRESFTRVLESRGFHVVGAEWSDGPDLVWVRADGTEDKRVRALRRHGFRGPILVGTPRSGAHPPLRDAIRIEVPATLVEIEAAINAALPKPLRTTKPMTDPYGYEIDATALEVLLTGTELVIAEEILAGKASVVLRTTLDERVFGYSVPAGQERRTTPLDSHVKSLRRKLILFGIEIVNVRGRGFLARLCRL